MVALKQMPLVSCQGAWYVVRGACTKKRLLLCDVLISLPAMLNHRPLVDRIFGGLVIKTQQSAIQKGQLVMKMQSDH